MNILLSQFLIVLLLSVQVYAIRAGGYWLAGHIRFNRFIKVWLEYIPGCVMMSVVAPVLLSKDPVAYVGCVLVAVTMLLTRNLFIAMLAGITVVIGSHLL